jgi:hypothetical protein
VLTTSSFGPLPIPLMVGYIASSLGVVLVSLQLTFLAVYPFLACCCCTTSASPQGPIARLPPLNNTPSRPTRLSPATSHPPMSIPQPYPGGAPPASGHAGSASYETSWSRYPGGDSALRGHPTPSAGFQASAL